MDSPVGSADSEAVEENLAADSTEPQPAPERRPTPVSVPPRPSAERSRRSTLVSPIPALMAASMRDTAGEAALLDAQGQIPSPLEQDQALAFDAESEYLVELDPSKTDS